MGNISGKQDEKYGEEEEEEDMEECSHSFHSPLLQHHHQAPVGSLQRREEVMQSTSSDDSNKEKGTGEHGGIPTMITWGHGEGNQVAIQGSWDEWKTREYLQRMDKEGFTIMKVLPAGVYHFRFIVDGQWRCTSQFPCHYDSMGNVFNVLDVQDMVIGVSDTKGWPESPPSPLSTYNSAPLSAEDFTTKVPELPPLLQQSLLDQPPPSSSSSSSRTSGHDHQDILEKPSPAVLNHLYVQKCPHLQSTVAMNSTHRFRNKYVTMVLYKSLHNYNKK